MPSIVVPSGSKNGRRPTLTEYVETYLNRMRVAPKESTMFTPAGRTVIHGEGERIIYGPRGEKILVRDSQAGTRVEHGNDKNGRGVEHAHVHVRPQTVTNITGVMNVDPDQIIRERERRQRGPRSLIIPRRS